MDYEEKYNKALEKAKEALLTSTTYPMFVIQEIFPELKESEDEKIRKRLISFLKSPFVHENITDEKVAPWIDWLEKQVEQKHNPYSGTSFEYNGHIWGMCARDNGVEILFDGELKAFLSLEKSFIYPIYPKPDLAHKSAIEAIKDNVGNNNKVEPKFHVGDWISGYYTNYKVLSINNAGYVVEDTDGDKLNILFENEKFHHLWTINDAKGGDVLVNGSNIFIFHFINDTRLMGYCHVNIDDELFLYDDIGKSECFCTIDAVVTPATKEQRDLLFSKMKQEGYEWDAKNKKLSKQTLKIMPKFCVGQLITDDNGTWYQITKIKCLDDWYYEVYDVGEDNTHLELCSIIDEKFRKNRFVDEIKKMMGD